MKHVVLATVAAFGLVAAAPAIAQTSSTVTTTTTETTGAITIAPEKRTVIKQRLSTAKPVEVKEKVTVGMTVPSTVELQSVPETIVSDVPSVKGYRYFVYNDEVVLVDPSSRKVVQIID
jgi:hypothetical protein